MGTRNLGILLNQGDDFNTVIQISGVSGPINISGYTFKGEMRASTALDSPVVAEFVFDILNQTSNEGQVGWSLPNSITSAIVTSISEPLQPMRQTTQFVFDVKMEDTIGNVTRIIQGIMYVSPQVTMEGF